MESSEDEKPLSQLDDELLHKRLLKNIKDARAHFAEWREQAKEDYDFYAGEQWSEEDKAVLAEQGRPAVAFNRVARTVNAVAGLELQNRQEVRYFPREVRDGVLSEMLSSAAKWARDNCDAEDEESEAFIDSLICGQGWTETRLDYEQDPEGMILIERRDPLCIFVDPASRKRNFDDARYVGRIEEYSLEEFRERFPDAEEQESRLIGEADDQPQPVISDPVEAYRGENGPRSDKKKIEVAQYQYYEVQRVHLVAGPDGNIVEMPVDRFKKMLPLLQEQRITYSRQSKPKRIYYQVFMTATQILERSPSPCNGFTFRSMTGLRDRNKNVWFGIVRLMKDPQRWANKWLSQIQHILNTQAKSGKVLYETGAVKDPKKFRAEWGDPSKPAEMNAGAISQNKLMQIQPAAYPEGTDRLLQYALSAVNDAPGVNLELLGLADRQQAGVLEESRKQAGVTILAAFFDGLRRYRKEQGRVLASFIRDYISDGRLIRISGDIGPQAVPLLRDQMAAKYDIIVDDAPTSTNMKERTFAILSQLLPQLLQTGIPVPPDLLDYAPLPEALIQKWKGYIQQQSEDPAKEQMKQLAMEGQQAEIDAKRSKANLDNANAEKAQADAQEALSRPQMEMAQMVAEMKLELQKMVAEMQIEHQKMLMQMQIKREEAEANAQIRYESAVSDAEIKREAASRREA